MPKKHCFKRADSKLRIDAACQEGRLDASCQTGIKDEIQGNPALNWQRNQDDGMAALFDCCLEAKEQLISFFRIWQGARKHLQTLTPISHKMAKMKEKIAYFAKFLSYLEHKRQICKPKLNFLPNMCKNICQEKNEAKGRKTKIGQNANYIKEYY